MNAFADLMVLTFVVSSMLGVGLSLTLSQIIAPLRRARLVVAALVANFVVAPLVVVGITKLIPLSEPLTVGLLLLGTAAGAPFLPKIAETAKGDLAFAVALMVLLLVGTLGYLPLMLPLLLPGVSVSSRKIAQPLLVSMILPLIVGLFVKARRESLAAGLRPLMSRVSNVSVIVALVLIPVMNYRSLLGIVGSGAILAGTLFVGVSFVAGFVLGGPMRESKMVLGFGTAGRNIPAAMLVTSQNFDDPQVAVMIIVVVLLTLFIVLTLAVLAPVLVELIPRVAVPAIVLEIVLGILVGPQGLQWAESNQQLEMLSRFGMMFLFFLAGLEIDFVAIRGRPIVWAGLGWLVSVCIAMAAGWGLQAAGVIVSGVVVATAFTTTALGALIPILRDAGTLNSKFGAFVSAAGAVGEFGPIVMISVALSTTGGSMSLLFIAVFAAITLSCAYLAATARPMPAIRLLKRKLHTSAQLPIRVSLLVLAALVVVTKQFGLDSVLGAIAAGVVVSLACRDHAGEVVRHKLEAMGFGFFIPIFFIATGMRFDLHALTATPAALLRVPLFLGCFLLARGVPVWLCRRDLPRGDWLPLALMSSTALPLVVAVAEIGIETNRMKPETAAALVGAGMVSMLLFPALALTLRSSTTSPADASSVGHGHEESAS